MRIVRLALVVVAACVVAGCASPSARQTSSQTTSRSQTTTQSQHGPQTTLQPPSTAGSGQPRPGCGDGTVTVTAAVGGQTTPVCATVGSLIVLRGGSAGAGGTWPGPPEIADPGVVSQVSSHAAGTSFAAQFKAIAAGSTSVIVPFVAGQDACTPTPCTPIPGAPLRFAVRVVS